MVTYYVCSLSRDLLLPLFDTGIQKWPPCTGPFLKRGPDAAHLGTIWSQ